MTFYHPKTHVRKGRELDGRSAEDKVQELGGDAELHELG